MKTVLRSHLLLLPSQPVNNHLFRGIDQTGGKPALQGAFDLARRLQREDRR